MKTYTEKYNARNGERFIRAQCPTSGGIYTWSTMYGVVPKWLMGSLKKDGFRVLENKTKPSPTSPLGVESR